jgi:hypothetical protein
LKIAFVDDCVHAKTVSSEFLVDVLKKENEVKRFWRSGIITFPEYNIIEVNKWKPDLILFFQRKPLFPILKRFDCKNVVYVPMYDSKGFFEGTRNLFRRIILGLDEKTTDLVIKPKYLYFSKRHYELDGKKKGSLVVKYFPKVKKQCEQDKPILFFWERIDSIPFSNIMKLFDLKYFEKVYFMQRNDEGSECLDSSFYDLPKNVVVIKDWLAKEEYERIMSECNVAVAPRNCEGIGHGFLDYMSRGMCVFAWDDATHNEYIKNGVNGYLFNSYDRIDLDKLYWKGCGVIAREQFKEKIVEWERDKQKILEWIK